MNSIKIQQLTQIAFLTALTIILGFFFKLPTPTGVTTLLDVGIYFTAFYLGGNQAAVVGSLSAFLFDLLSGYPQWMFISLLAHGGQGFLAGLSDKWRWLGCLAATVFMVAVYLLASTAMNGFGAALAEVGTNTMQNLVGLVGGYLLVQVANRFGGK